MRIFLSNGVDFLRYAQIVDRKVHCVMTSNYTLKELYERFYCRDDIELIDITSLSEVNEGWRYDDGKFTEPKYVIETERADCRIIASEVLELAQAVLAILKYIESGDKMLIYQPKIEAYGILVKGGKMVLINDKSGKEVVPKEYQAAVAEYIAKEM